MVRMLLLPLTRRKDLDITCSNDIGQLKTHGKEQRYVSPTTGNCRKLIVQAIAPSGKFEVAVKDNTDEASKVAIWLLSHSPIRGWIFFKWIWRFVWFTGKLLWPVVWFLVELYFNTGDDSSEDTESSYDTGYYKPYLRQFRGQLWAARSRKEHSSRVIKEEDEINTRTHACYPRILMIRNLNQDGWVKCADREIIIHTKFIAISYRALDVYTRGDNEEIAQFIEKVRAAVLGQQFHAYWLDLECVDESERNRDVYCMADVYRRAQTTLIMLGRAASGENECWRNWGERVWTFPEALLSPRLCYAFRDREEVKPLSLFELANLAYTNTDDEQAIVNAYGGKDPLERLERLVLLKKAIWRRAMRALPVSSGPPPQPKLDMIGDGPVTDKVYKPYTPHKAEQVYALMGFFEHRIQPTDDEDELMALARLSMANDSDRITERMVSMLPSTITPEACWYADSDIYDANLWDILPEIQVAGVTKNGALVLDGCRAVAIRWKDFPGVTFSTKLSLRRTVAGFMPYFSWPVIIIGLGIIWEVNRAGGIALISIGILLLILSPVFFLYAKSGRIATAQPWLIGVKGVIDRNKIESHLYGGTIKHFPRMFYTPSGSPFSQPEQLGGRRGSDKQYEDAEEREKSGPDAGHMYTLIDTYSSTVYYFRAERAPTVCIFAGREGGLGRFVLCSENCKDNELHKETVLRMPTGISQRMQLCGWVALG